MTGAVAAPAPERDDRPRSVDLTPEELAAARRWVERLEAELAGEGDQP